MQGSCEFVVRGQSLNLSWIAAILFGLAPGLAGTYVEPAAALKAAAGLAGGGAQSRSHRGRVGRLLVAAETTLALVLLVGAGLLLRTLINLKRSLVIIPCHRVIGAAGRLVGYGGGLTLKRRLLELEAQAAAPRLF